MTSTSEPTSATPAHLALFAATSPNQLSAALESAGDPAAFPAVANALIGIHQTQDEQGGVPSHRAALLLTQTGAAVVSGPSPSPAAAQQVAFLLPGLGDHYLNMGLDLYRTLPVFREHFQRCAAWLEPELGVDLREVVYPKRDADDPEPRKATGLDLRSMLGRRTAPETEEERRLNQMRLCQPALFAVEYALAQQWRSWGLAPEIMLGYSLGEYVAACLAGVLSLEDSLAVVTRRAELIEELPPGAMLAVTLSEESITPLLGTHLSISAVNGPEFCVVSGPEEEITQLEQKLRAAAATTRRVRSTHAFHSKMMEPIADRVTAIMRGMRLRAPSIPYVSNVTGALIRASEATDPAYWAAHLCQPVRFMQGLSALNAPILLEVGPGQTLCSLASAALATRSEPSSAVASMRHAYDPDSDTAVLLRAVAGLWTRGAKLDWERFPSDSLISSNTLENQPREQQQAARPPATQTERLLATFWEELLKCEPPAADAHFFQLGANSLVATRLIDRVHKALRVRLPLREVYENPTLERMGAAIDALSRRTSARSARRPAPAPERSRSVPRPAPSVAPKLFTLPNGLRVSHQNEAETRHFYDDIFVHRTYAKNGIQIRNGACVLDVGGNIGLFTLFAHRQATGVRVFMFEPAPALFAIAKENVARHGIRATVLNFGLSNRDEHASFTFYPHSAGMSSFHADKAEERHNLKTIIANQQQAGNAEAAGFGARMDELLDARFTSVTFEARLRRLSDVLREQDIQRVDLMKVDVQKCELEVIEGIDDADWPKFSQIVLEAHDVNDRVATLRSLFARRGFSVTVEQDELYAGTNIYNIYALRKD
ncbi:FkbM family methyltransferase [Haliangium ochraceum]|uniref:Methyltransferase FkbM family n=1 Tax=Haliangium ochraceum (strain DSM 14365 / JCM 11303 / SMP-2) TaxID=502025 RepID=D0LPV2_HALO1|nr:FkbM family methyltransferase [Haliangium ochraceum]ACY15465.1 methyltransferase FkbM family [Haliangium ochraceum DSM 14365]